MADEVAKIADETDLEVAATADGELIPDHEGLIEILSAEDAPPHIILDIGGSADLNGDGLVQVSLDEDGNLFFQDA